MSITIYARGYDSVNIHAIPKALVSKGDVISYYLDGDYAVASVKTVQAVFGAGVHYNPIDVNGTRATMSRTIDVEKLDFPADSLEQYITEWNATNPRHKNGGRCMVYCDRDTIPDVRKGTGRYILGIDYTLWVATGDGTIATAESLDLRYNGSIVENGVSMCQNLWFAGYDESVILRPDMVWE
jgi:hypothetical protein